MDTVCTGLPACIGDPTYIRDPAYIRTSDQDPRLVMETWLLFETRLVIRSFTVTYFCEADPGCDGSN